MTRIERFGISNGDRPEDRAIDRQVARERLNFTRERDMRTPNPFRKVDSKRYTALINDRRLSIVKCNLGWSVQEATENGPITIVSVRWLGVAMKEALAIANGQAVQS